MITTRHLLDEYHKVLLVVHHVIFDIAHGHGVLTDIVCLLYIWKYFLFAVMRNLLFPIEGYFTLAITGYFMLLPRNILCWLSRHIAYDGYHGIYFLFANHHLSLGLIYFIVRVWKTFESIFLMCTKTVCHFIQSPFHLIHKGTAVI